MVMANSKPLIVQTMDGMSFRLYRRGDEFMSWLEDTSGNPLIEDKDGNIYYAEWLEKEKRFRKRGYFLKSTRRRFIKQTLEVPSPEDIKDITQERQYQLDHMPHVDIPLPSPRDPNACPDHDFNTGGHPHEHDHDHHDEHDHSHDLGTSPPAGSLKRPMVVIYVRFSDSTGDSVPDAYITDMITNKSKFGSLAHYYNLNLSGAPEITILDNKIYHVTLDTNGKSYGTDFNSIRSEILLPALTKTAQQGFDFAKYATSGLSGQDIDRWTCTPLVLVHAQEAATATGNPNLWGHAYRKGTGITLGGHALMNAQMFGVFHGGTTKFSIGILAHESGHALFDLPDLYDIKKDDGEINGFGNYSLMSAGSWGSSPSHPQSGSCPVGLDGYCIYKISKQLCQEITKDGAQHIDSPYKPHYITSPKVKGEVYILQPRCFKDYDESLKVYLGGNPRSGVLVMHRDPWNDDVLNPTSMCAHIIEAHGGEQHLRVNDGGNAGEDTDFFGNDVKAFGDAVDDPSSKLIRVKPGEKPGFDVTEIAISECESTYNIKFNEAPKPPDEPDPPNPPDPPDPPNPPDPPDPPEPPKPQYPKCSCKRPRFWRAQK